MKKMNFPALSLFFFLIALLEFFVRRKFLSEALFPAPSQVVETIWVLHSDFLAATTVTLINTSLGLGLSILVGGLLAFIFSLSPLLRRAILPFAIFFQTVPIIAIAPLLVIYFGFGSPTVIASSFIVSVFPIIANTLVGLESSSSLQKDLFNFYQADRWCILIKLKLPCSYPYILSGIKISIGLSIIGTIAGEFVAGGGLGAMIDSARTQQRVDIVFAALLLLSLIGISGLFFLQVLHRLIIKHRPFFQGDL